MSQKTYIAGVGMIQFAKPGASGSYIEMGAQAVRQALQDAGIGYDLVFPGHDAVHVARFARVYLTVLLFRKPGSLVVFQKIYSSGWYGKALLLLLRLRPKHTLYDTDDAEHLRAHLADRARDALAVRFERMPVLVPCDVEVARHAA